MKAVQRGTSPLQTWPEPRPSLGPQECRRVFRWLPNSTFRNGRSWRAPTGWQRDTPDKTQALRCHRALQAPSTEIISGMGLDKGRSNSMAQAMLQSL